MENRKIYKKDELIEKEIPTSSTSDIYKYLFVIIYYFILVDIILGFLLLPMARKNIIVDDLTAATTISEAVSYDKDGLGLIKYNDYEELKDSFYVEDALGDFTEIIITIGFVEFMVGDLKINESIVTDINTYVLIANYTNQNLDIFYDDDSVNIEYLEDIITGKTIKFRNGSNINFYYNPTYYNHDDFKDYKHFQVRNDFKTEFGIIHNLIYYLLLFIPLLALFFKPLAKAFIELFKDKEKASKIVPAIFIALAVGIGSGLISNLIKVAAGLPMAAPLNQKTIEEMMSSSLAVLLVITVVIFGPFVEEVVFRKSFFGFIKNKTAALITSSLLFALIHVSNEPSLIYSLVNSVSYLAGGLAFGYLYIKNDKNIALVIIAHSVYNLISVLPMFF